MPSFVSVGPLDELAIGKGRCVALGGRDVALFRLDEGLFAIDNTCPHRGGPLAEGDVTGCVVYCPLHAWSFDLRTGVSPGNPRAAVETFPVRVVEGRVEIAVPPEVETNPDAESQPADV